MTITAAREEFLADIITTAVEGGIGYWSVCTQYQWVDRDLRLRVVVGRPVQGEDTRATIEDMEDDNREYHITPSVIEIGIRRIVGQHTNVGLALYKAARIADLTDDAGEFDADDCDCIVQVGLFGEIRYG